MRPIIGSSCPNIKGLEVSGFKRQLEYFSKERSIVSTSDVLKAVEGDLTLPKNAVWLTFDDGYKDHFEYVAPLLEQYGFDGAFFPVSDCYTKNQIVKKRLLTRWRAGILIRHLLSKIGSHSISCR